MVSYANAGLVGDISGPGNRRVRRHRRGQSDFFATAIHIKPGDTGYTDFAGPD